MHDVSCLKALSDLIWIDFVSEVRGRNMSRSLEIYEVNYFYLWGLYQILQIYWQKMFFLNISCHEKD